MVNAPEGLNQIFLGRLYIYIIERESTAFRKNSELCERERERPRFGKNSEPCERERESSHVSEKFGKNQNLRCHLVLNASAGGLPITPNGNFF